MQVDEIIQKVNQAIAEEFEVAVDSLKPETHLGDDLELDSLDGVDLIAAMQRTFGIKFPEEEARQLRTMGDIYAFVEKLVGQQAGKG